METGDFRKKYFFKLFRKYMFFFLFFFSPVFWTGAYGDIYVTDDNDFINLGANRKVHMFPYVSDDHISTYLLRR